MIDKALNELKAAEDEIRSFNRTEEISSDLQYLLDAVLSNLDAAEGYIEETRDINSSLRDSLEEVEGKLIDELAYQSKQEEKTK